MSPPGHLGPICTPWPWTKGAAGAMVTGQVGRDVGVPREREGETGHETYVDSMPEGDESWSPQVTPVGQGW